MKNWSTKAWPAQITIVIVLLSMIYYSLVTPLSLASEGQFKHSVTGRRWDINLKKCIVLSYMTCSIPAWLVTICKRKIYNQMRILRNSPEANYFTTPIPLYNGYCTVSQSLMSAPDFHFTKSWNKFFLRAKSVESDPIRADLMLISPMLLRKPFGMWEVWMDNWSLQGVSTLLAIHVHLTRLLVSKV